MIKHLFTTLSLFVCMFNSSAQQYMLSGSVQDTEGQPIPFVSIYVKNTTVGASANQEGRYTLKLEKGTFTLVYRAIGFKTAEKLVSITENTLQNVVLASESYTLSEVTIGANAEDPAYEIMRQAISKRKEHLTEIKEFSSDVYIKGVQKLVGAPKKLFGRNIQSILDVDTSGKGILYLSESTSTFSYRYPDKIQEVMISSKTAGKNNAFSFNKASDLITNFYENILLEDKLSSRGFVSPIADNALFYYRYKLLGSGNDNGETVHKIQLIPRRENDPVFRGIVYIKDGSWHLVNADVYLTKNTGINLLDTLNISQQFLKVGDTYTPSSMNFEFNGNVLGFKFEGYYAAVYSNHNLQPNFPEGYFTGEILKITKAVNRKDSLFWLNNRPIPLSREERRDYTRKDSIEAVRNSDVYLDSVERAQNKFGIFKLITGYGIKKRKSNTQVQFQPLYKSVYYNTVEGFAINPSLTYTKRLEDHKYYNITPELKYGFSNKTLTGNVSANYYYRPDKRANISLSIGSGIYDLNNFGSMGRFGNSINSLLFETNFSKFYQKEFINLGTTRELSNGLQASISAQYASNYNLENTSSYKFKDVKDKEFTSNNPYTPLSETPLFPTYEALTVVASLNYTIGQTYITRPEGKFYQPSKYPEIDLSYKKGIKGAFGSDVDYDLVSLEVSQDRISSGLWGYSSFVVGAGKFLNNNQIYYPEARHFRGNNSLTLTPDLRKFLFLDFYLFSTDEQYFEAHFEHNFSGLFTNKVPLLRKLKLEELVGASYLTQPVKTNYTEFYFGIQRLVFRATYGFAYDGNKRIDHGFRISYGF